MITKDNFKKIEPLIMEAIDELFKHCIQNENKPNDFLVFLVNGHYYEDIIKNGYDPYIIGEGMDGAKDQDRMAFVELFTSMDFETDYLNQSDPNLKYSIRRNSTILSMMVYTHFWESKVFLRRLKLLAMMSNGEKYDWHYKVNVQNTYEFIRDEIRSVFKNQNLKIYDVIQSTYRSQIRNAFAHSDFHLSQGKVYLDNYNPSDSYTIDFITWEKFDEIIIKTLLIHHCLISKIDEYSTLLGQQNPDRDIYVPQDNGKTRTIHYRQTGPIYRWLWPSQLKK